jgi:hypothetical protein
VKGEGLRGRGIVGGDVAVVKDITNLKFNGECCSSLFDLLLD